MLETDLMTREEMAEFVRWFDENIGTEREVNEDEPGRFYVVVFELTPAEEKKVLKFLEELKR
ncbi:MAG: hypothetical protein GXO16_05845 [Epsilonproteobacteria bacterium]|nr:hypothetical protein [Campylobacterota bacterium]